MKCDSNGLTQGPVEKLVNVIFFSHATFFLKHFFSTVKMDNDFHIANGAKILSEAFGLSLDMSPKDLLDKLNEQADAKLSDLEISKVLSSFQSSTESSSVAARVVDGKPINSIRKCNRNQKLESLNLCDGVAAAEAESKIFRDAAGLMHVTKAEKMNLEPNQSLPPLSFGAANAVFFDEALPALEAMKQQAAMAMALAASLAANVKKAEALIDSQRNMLQQVKHDETIPMTGGLRALMNQNKMKLETFAIASASWLSGVYLPKIAMCLLTSKVRPQARIKSENFLAKIDAVLSSLKQDQDPEEAIVQQLDEAHAQIFAELQKAGLTAALINQKRGGFSGLQKREDHAHTKFVTACLREQFFFFIATAPLQQIGRRITRKQFPLPRLLVGVERFLDTDSNGTVDAFREGNGSFEAFLPPMLMSSLDLTRDQFDGGGSISIITHKTLRLEKTGVGVQEAEAALASNEPHEVRHAKLLEQAQEELQQAEKSTVPLNITDTSRTNEERAFNRELATERAQEDTAERADFVRENSWVFVTQKVAGETQRDLLAKDARVSPYAGIHAPRIAQLTPSLPTWMDSEQQAAAASAIADTILKKAEQEPKNPKKRVRKVQLEDEPVAEEKQVAAPAPQPEEKRAAGKSTRLERHLRIAKSRGQGVDKMVLRAPVGIDAMTTDTSAIGAGAGAEDAEDGEIEVEGKLIPGLMTSNSQINSVILSRLHKFAQGRSVNAGLLTSFALQAVYAETDFALPNEEDEFESEISKQTE